MDVNAATVFAAWAAGASGVLSLFALALSYYTFKRDKAKINLSAMIGIMVPGPLDQKYFMITITNSGRRNITITHLAGTYFPWWGKIATLLAKVNILKLLLIWTGLFSENWSEFILITSNRLQNQLGEGQYISETFPMTPDMINNILRTKKIYALDSVGNQWYLSRSRLKEIQQSINH